MTTQQEKSFAVKQRNEHIELIQKGKPVPGITYEEKSDLQYEFKKYNHHVLKFIFSLEVKDIAIEHHLDAVKDDLSGVIGWMQKKKMNIDVAKKRPEVLDYLFKVEQLYPEEALLINHERSVYFNKYMNHNAKDYFVKSLLFKDINLETDIKLVGSDPKNYPTVQLIDSNTGNFSDVKSQLNNNIKEFEKTFNLKDIVADSNYENYLINSPVFNSEVKQMLTKKGMNLSSLFEQLTPILPSADKEQSFIKIVAHALFDSNGISIKNHHHLFNELVNFVSDKNVEFDTKTFISKEKQNIFTNMLSIYKNAYPFVKLLKQGNELEFNECEKYVAKNLFNYASFKDLNELSSYVENIKCFIPKALQYSGDLFVDKEHNYDRPFKILKEQVQDDIKFEFFVKNYKKLSNSLEVLGDFPNMHDQKKFLGSLTMDDVYNQKQMFSLKIYYDEKNRDPNKNDIVTQGMNVLFDLTPEQKNIVEMQANKVDILEHEMKSFLSPYCEKEIVEKIKSAKPKK